MEVLGGYKEINQPLLSLHGVHFKEIKMVFNTEEEKISLFLKTIWKFSKRVDLHCDELSCDYESQDLLPISSTFLRSVDSVSVSLRMEPEKIMQLIDDQNMKNVTSLIGYGEELDSVLIPLVKRFDALRFDDHLLSGFSRRNQPEGRLRPFFQAFLNGEIGGSPRKWIKYTSYWEEYKDIRELTDFNNLEKKIIFMGRKTDERKIDKRETLVFSMESDFSTATVAYVPDENLHRNKGTVYVDIRASVEAELFKNEILEKAFDDVHRDRKEAMNRSLKPRIRK